jgi:hypothetical protein
LAAESLRVLDAEVFKNDFAIHDFVNHPAGEHFFRTCQADVSTKAGIHRILRLSPLFKSGGQKRDLLQNHWQQNH